MSTQEPRALPRAGKVAAEAVGRVLQDAGLRFNIRVAGSVEGPPAFEVRFPPRLGPLTVEYHAALAPYQAAPVAERLRGLHGGRSQVGLCVRRLTLPLLDACKAAGVALFDLEGNAFLHMQGIYMERIRPSRERGRERTSGTVFTAKASRLLRALLSTYPQGASRSDLARQTGLSAGFVSTLSKRLLAQKYVTGRAGQLQLDEPDRLLNDWLAHYRFDRHRKLSFAISAGNYEDGIMRLGAQLETAVSRFAWTGWTGAHLRAPHTAPSAYMAYVAKTPDAMPGVFPVEHGGNVTLYVPQDEGVFQFTTDSKFGEVVSDAQLYLDLSRMPGRANELADALRHHRLDFPGMDV